MLPQNPLARVRAEAAGATRRLAAQDPETTAALVRQNLADRYSKAQTETQGGNRQAAGAKFHQSVAGNDQRQQVPDAVLRALPGGLAAASMPQLLDVLQSTMRRKGAARTALQAGGTAYDPAGRGNPVCYGFGGVLSEWTDFEVVDVSSKPIALRYFLRLASRLASAICVWRESALCSFSTRALEP